MKSCFMRTVQAPKPARAITPSSWVLFALPHPCSLRRLHAFINGLRNIPYYLLTLLIIAYVPRLGSQCNSLARLGTFLRLVKVLDYAAVAGIVDGRDLIRRVAQFPFLWTRIRGGTGRTPRVPFVIMTPICLIVGSWPICGSRV